MTVTHVELLQTRERVLSSRHFRISRYTFPVIRLRVVGCDCTGAADCALVAVNGRDVRPAPVAGSFLMKELKPLPRTGLPRFVGEVLVIREIFRSDTVVCMDLPILKLHRGSLRLRIVSMPGKLR